MRIRIHPSFVPYLLCIAFVSSPCDCLSLLIAFFIHECSHYAAAKLTGEQIAGLEITPCGGVMTYKPGAVPSKGSKGILVHSAGPIGNWLLLAVIPVLHREIPPAFMRSLLFANVSLLALNLLPVFPLDGGHILFCLGYYFFPVAALIRCLSVLGMIVGALGISFCVYGLIYHQTLNCTLLIVSLYLVISEERRRRTLLCENICTIIHERMMQTNRIRKRVAYQVPDDTPLLCLLELLKQNASVSFLFPDKGGELELTEAAFCRALLSTCNPTVRDAYSYQILGKENAFSPENTRFPS